RRRDLNLEAGMRARWRWTGLVMISSAMCATRLAAQSAADVCALATNEEFQRAYGVDPRIGIIPDDPTPTEMVWGPHCDFSAGSMDLFTKKSPPAELDRVLALTKAEKQRVPVSGLGQKAFFTVIYPDDQYRRAGLLAVFLGPKILTITMDAHQNKVASETRPGLETLAKLVVPRVK
ncbi:MAG TPA: hypothetical protein VHR43_11285, partial [Gemmatimonadales bacterium]|nr:hypothetical protein [Gemmatimonadales bacterium]